MWAVARGLGAAIFGDEIVKYVLYAAAGVFVFVILQGGGFFLALPGQSWGVQRLAGVTGAAQQSGPGASAPPPAARAAVPTLAPMPMAELQTATRIGQLISAAMAWLGVRYLWGGCSRSGVDCSCFVQNVLRAIGVDAPRVTTAQMRWARPVSLAELQPGDLLFFNNTCSDCGANPTHVAFALGDGRMIHCGDPCQISPIDRAHFASAGRIP